MAELSVIRKTTNSYTVTFTNNGSVQDITGWTVFFTVKKNTAQVDTQATISKTVTSHSDPSHGVTMIVLSPTDTDVNSGTYVYDIRYKDTSNNLGAIVPGTFTVLDYVTQRTS